MEDEPRVAEPLPGEGICVECGGPIPRELLATVANAFRCAACRQSQETGDGSDQGGMLKRTA